MQVHVSAWPSQAYDIKERHFRKGLYSILSIDDVTTRADDSVHFTWAYMWRDFGYDSVVTKAVTIKTVPEGYLVNDRVVSTIELLEEACFRGEWDACCSENIEELMNM
jgi:hypothetical protein